MDFLEIANARQSCRKYDEERTVEKEKLEAILQAARLAPSAHNVQPYHLTVCTGAMAKQVGEAAADAQRHINTFAPKAPVLIVISQEEYTTVLPIGWKEKGTDYRPLDIGIVTAYITAEAAAQGLGSCILGWVDNEKIQQLCGLKDPVKLVITVGYAHPNASKRGKVRRSMEDLVTYLED